MGGNEPKEADERGSGGIKMVKKQKKKDRWRNRPMGRKKSGLELN